MKGVYFHHQRRKRFGASFSVCLDLEPESGTVHSEWERMTQIFSRTLPILQAVHLAAQRCYPHSRTLHLLHPGHHLPLLHCPEREEKTDES